MQKRRNLKLSNMRITLILIIALLFASTRISFADSSSKFAGGSGTKEDPYLIKNEEQLGLIHQDVTKHYRLIEDIRLTPGWSSIHRFSGSLDGNGHIIDGLSIVKTVSSALDQYNFGLFGSMEAGSEVKNLGLTNVDIEVRAVRSDAKVGGLAGVCSGTVTNCHVTGNIRGYGSGEGSSLQVGGIAGWFFGKGWGDSSEAHIKTCYTVADVTVTGLQGVNSVATAGGIVGSQSHYGYISRSAALGNKVKAEGYGYQSNSTFGYVCSGRIVGRGFLGSSIAPLLTDNYANADMELGENNLPKDDINGTDINADSYNSEEWWKTFWDESWGGNEPDNEKPWIRDSERRLPALYPLGAGSNGRSLDDIKVSAGSLSPSFSHTIKDYQVTVGADIKEITLGAVLSAENPNAEISGTGTKTLKPGENIFEILVTAENRAKKIYTVTVTRNAPSEPVSYEVTQGADSTWTKGSKGGLLIVSEADFAEFVGVKVDGKFLDSMNYEAQEGSTRIHLKNEYLETLHAGVHDIEILHELGAAHTSFEIKNEEQSNDQGGDDHPNNDNTSVGTSADPASSTTTDAVSAKINTNEGTKISTPHTGDNTSVVLPVIAVIAAASIFIVLLVKRLRDKNKK